MDNLKNAELFILDMDGTLYLGDEVIPGAVEFIKTLQDLGKQYIYLTNNSSRAGTDYVLRLKKLGFPCTDENIFTSGMASGMYLKEHYGNAGIYPIGTAAFINELKSYGVNLTDKDPAAVIVGFDTELVYGKLERGVHFLRRGADFIAANPDLVCPMPNDEVLPDCGSICSLLTCSTGKEPLYIGKPNRRMIDILSKKTGVPNHRIVAVGDRLYTDIAVAVNAGSVSVCVLSGETTAEMIDKSPIKPDYTFDSVRELSGYLK